MSTRPLINITSTLNYSTTQIGRTVRGPDVYNAAVLANVTALARPFRSIHIANVPPGTYAASYRRSHDSIKQARIRWTTRLSMPDGVSLNPNEELTMTLTITDALGNTAPSSTIPAGFKGESFFATESTEFPSVPTLGGSGWLDLKTIALTLTDPSWTFTFVVARPTGSTLYVDVIEMVEIGRTVIDTADTYGVDPADFQPGQPTTAGTATTAGTLRLAQTIEGAIATQPEMLSLVWPSDTGAAIPQTASATYAAMTNLEQGAGSGTSMRFRVPVRPIYYSLASGGTTAGERARWRVLYYVAGGGTADVQISTGSTGSPYSITGLTGASWQWSAWQDIALPTDGTAAIATLSIKGQTSAGTLYLAAVSVQSY